MPSANIVIDIPSPGGFRAAAVEGRFDIPRTEKRTLSWSVDLPIDDVDWTIGAIVGSSGSGKSTIARRMFPGSFGEEPEWHADCLLDDFPQDLSTEAIIASLVSVGFSSAPAWLRPYRVLSTGQKFRADLARRLM